MLSIKTLHLTKTETHKMSDQHPNEQELNALARQIFALLAGFLDVLVFAFAEAFLHLVVQLFHQLAHLAVVLLKCLGFGVDPGFDGAHG